MNKDSWWRRQELHCCPIEHQQAEPYPTASQRTACARVRAAIDKCIGGPDRWGRVEAFFRACFFQPRGIPQDPLTGWTPPNRSSHKTVTKVEIRERAQLQVPFSAYGLCHLQGEYLPRCVRSAGTGVVP